MGQASAKDNDTESQLVTMLRQYRILKEKSNDHVTVLENIYNPSLIVEMRHLKFSQKEEFEQKLRSYEKIKTISHPCILKTIGIHQDKLEQFCSTIFSLSIITERPAQTLLQYLEQRGQSDFSETELWFFIDCIVSAQAQFQKLLRQTKSLTFKDFLLCPVIQQQTGVGQVWKLAPHEIDFDENYYVSVFERFRQNISIMQMEQREFHLYPSPEEMKLLKSKATEPSGDTSKQSVFTLGMIILHVAQGESCDFIYDMDTLELSKDLLSERLNELQEKFSQPFCDLMNDMLIYDCDNRPDYVALDQQLSIIPTLKGQRVQDRAAAYSGPVMVHQPLQSKATTNQNLLLNNYSSSQSQLIKTQFKQNEQSELSFPYGSLQQPTSKQTQSQYYQAGALQYNPSTLPIQSQFTSQNHASQSEQIMVTESYQNGSRYTGEKINGMRHGKGRMNFAEGGFYEGQWKDNTMCGKGQLYYDNGQKAYEGEFKDGKFNNFGHLWNKQPINKDQSFDYRNFKQLGDLWLKYEGDFNDDKKHGFGLLSLTNGETYTGSFKDDYLHGYGAFKKTDGVIINGNWEFSILSRQV